MADVIKKGREIIEEGLESLKSIKKDKREYREFVARIKALPTSYAFVYRKMTEYMWGLSGGGDGYDMVAIHADLLELFEAGAADGRQVPDITGEDVAAFCDELLRNAKTFTGDRREKLNREIQKGLSGVYAR